MNEMIQCLRLIVDNFFIAIAVGFIVITGSITTIRIINKYIS